MLAVMDLGRVNTRGAGFRARAEARQREYRAGVLRAGSVEWGHWLDEQATKAGMNFVIPEAHRAALERDKARKGVGPRTFQNMLSSQAMCFNIFTPLSEDVVLAAAILRPLIPGLTAVRAIHFEYTPPADIFGDQTGRGGVDCDLLVEADWDDGARAIVVVETKFVETEFSGCGFREGGRAAAGKAVCPSDIAVRADPGACLYSSKKSYRYWERTIEAGNVERTRLPQVGCPFGGPLWQLWVNHTLAHVEAESRGARHARFAVCAPGANDVLLRSGAVLDEFRQLLANPWTLLFVDVDSVIREISRVADADDRYRPWSDGLAARYANL